MRGKSSNGIEEMGWEAMVNLSIDKFHSNAGWKIQ